MAEQQMINSVASSSNSSMLSSKKYKYDVFLSFRGEDTRRNFTSHLYEALLQNKVETYIDYQLEKGDEITPALIKAIKDSCISIVIFSENYASSKWCLGELSKILECKKIKGQIVIPVFYNIDPSHVRKQTGSYEQAFAKHVGESRCKCNKWKAALTEAANLAGWDSQAYWTDPELLKDIVTDVLRKLPPRYPNQLKGLVGIEENYKQIESLLKIGSSEARTIGIWGMGGIGKTTLATALYDKLSHEFEGCCFLPNVSEKSDKLEVLCDNSGISKLRGKKVFIVLDDVATSEQLEKLIVDYDFWEPGSRVIVTTRNKQILSPVDEIYQVQDLSSQHSLQLFCLTVFGEKQPKDGYEDLSRRAISYCKGIPLALKVLGASLRSRSKEAWESELRKLKKISNVEIHKVLKLSYDGLDCSQKDIFLDIACFFKGLNRDWVTSLLEACDFFAASGIEVLLDKALITISGANKLEMHDLIQEMGWEIVRQESIKDFGRRSRLWKLEEVQDVLKYNMGTDFVEGITLDLRNLTGDLYLSSNSLAKLSNMRFLKIHDWCCTYRFNVYLPNGLESLPYKLRYFHWDGFSLESLPYNFGAEQLVELCMCDSKLKKLWDGVQNLVNLKQIDLCGSRDLIEIPDLSKAEKLERLRLGYCESLHHLHVPSKSLHLLELNRCSSLKEFSVTSEEMRELNLSHTAIRALPSSIWCNKKLRFLYLSGCKNLDSVGNKLLSDDLHNASKLSLRELDLCGTSVESLPANIQNLSMLTTLWLDDCRKLVSLPKLPPYLQQLRAFNCTLLETDTTQRLVLQHMLQSSIPSYMHKHRVYSDGGYFILAGDHVTDECWLRAAESSITLPCLPQPDLLGFILCIILKGPVLNGRVSCSIYQGGRHVGWNDKSVLHCASLISDHVLFLYHDVCKVYRESKVHISSDIPFNFEFDYYDVKVGRDQERIKGCGVFPVYFSTSGLKLVSSSSSSSNMELEPQIMKMNRTSSV